MKFTLKSQVARKKFMKKYANRAHFKNLRC